MHVVINIDEDLVKLINENEFGLYDGRVYDAIRNGTPLPKGHGRLIDANALDVGQVVDECGYRCGYKYIMKYELDNASTIIEADSNS